MLDQREEADHTSTRRQVLAGAVLTLVVLISSSNNIASKRLLQEASPALVTGVRFTMVGLAFYLPLFLLMRRHVHGFTRSEWVRLGVAAVFGYYGSTVIYTVGVSMTTATYAGLMIMTGPLWTTLLERAVLGTPIGRVQGLGILIAFASAAYLATGGTLAHADAPLLIGSVLVMAAQTAWGGFTLVTKPMLSRRPPLMVLACTSLAGLPFFLPVSGAMGLWEDLHRLPELSSTAWLTFAYMILVPGIISQVLYTYGLRDVTASQAMAYTYLTPVFTALLAAMLLGEAITLTTVLGGAAIVFGLWLTNQSRPSRARSQ